MNDKQILKWAIKGIAAEIDELEKQVRKGQQMVNDLHDGKPIKSPLSEYEILKTIRIKKAEIEKLSKEQFDLRWQLSVEEEK